MSKRIGLPVALKMRHDAHYVEQLTSFSGAAVGRMIRVNGVSLQVIGILPRGFNGLSGTAQLWVPATMAPRLSYGDYLVTNQNFMSVAGRLRAGVTLEQARAELEVLGREIDRTIPSQSNNPATRFAATALVRKQLCQVVQCCPDRRVIWS